VDRAYDIHEREELWYENLKQIDHTEGLGIRERMILTWIWNIMGWCELNSPG